MRFKTKFKINRIHLFLLIIIFLTAVFFNFHGIKQRGLINWDEPYYLTYSQFVVSAIKNLPFLFEQFNQSNLDILAIENKLEGRPIETAKPGHVALISMFGLLTGGISDYTGSVFSAIFGILTVALVFLVGRQFFDERTGLLAASLLTVSPYFLMYSRSAMPETDALFFFLLAIFLYYNSVIGIIRPWLLYFSGLFLGLALAINYRWLFVGPFIFLMEIKPSIEYIKNHNYADIFKRFLLLFTGLVTFPILFQLPYFIFEMFKPLPFPSYWEMLLNLYSRQPFQDSFLYPHSLFIRLFWDLLGPFGCLAVLGAMILFLFRRNFEDFLILLPFVIPLIAFSLKTRGDKAVALSLTIPFVALLAGNFVSSLSDRLWRTKTKPLILSNLTALGLGLLLVIPQIITSWQLIGIKSGYRSAISWLLENGGEKHFSTARSISNFYVGGRDRVVPLPNDLNEIREFKKRGYRYLLLDWREKKTNQIETEIKNKLKPVFCVDNKPMTFWPYIIDDFHYRHDDPNFIKNVAINGFDKILVFDLSDL